MPVQARAEAPTIPAGTPSAAQTIEDVFLTPRVLDKRAFEDYTQSLKRLIQDATGEGESLSRTAADVRVLRDQLAAATVEAQKRLDAAMRVVTPNEVRPGEGPAGVGVAGAGVASKAGAKGRAGEGVSSRGETLPVEVLRALESRLEGRLAERVAADIEARVAERVESVVKARLGPLVDTAVGSASRPGEPVASSGAVVRAQARVDELVREAGEAIDASVARVDRLAAALEERLNAVPVVDTTALERAVAGAADRAASFERSVEAAARRFASETNEQGSRVTAEARQAIERAREECEAAVRQISTGASLRVRKAQQDSEAVLEGLEARVPERLAQARAQFESLLASLSSESQERAAWIKAALGDLAGPKVQEVRELIDRASAQADASAEGSLAAALSRVDRAREAVESDVARIGELGKQVGLMRDLLARSILEGVGRIDALDARQEELLASTARAIEQFAHEIDTLRGGLGALAPRSRAPEEGASDADHALSAVQGRVELLQRQTEEAQHAAEWLAGLIDRAARAGIDLDQSLSSVQSMASSPEPKPAAPVKASRRRGEAKGDSGADSRSASEGAARA